MAEEMKSGCENAPSSVSGRSALNSQPLAMSYVPFSKWEDLYEPEVGLQRGTIFACLDLPFIGKEAAEDGNS